MNISLEARLRARAHFCTLDPARARARLPTELEALVLRPSDDPALARAFRVGMLRAYEAMLDAFPDNLLWDLEALASALVEQARGGGEPAIAIERSWDRVAELQYVFGRRGPIRFRYIHDFIYGFDWARWVAKEPAARATVGPYDPAFVERMHRRGGELIALIEDGSDLEYGPLPGSEIRNPFGFSREPDDELALHRSLASRDELPVLAWQPGAQPHWQRPFTQLRSRAAAALRISA